MKKIIAVGLGEIFRKNIHYLSMFFEIVGVSDNHKNVQTEYIYIAPNSISTTECDFVVVMSEIYFANIKSDLCKEGVGENKIISYQKALEMCDQAKIEADKKEYERLFACCDDTRIKNFGYDAKNDYLIIDEWRKEAGNLQDYFWQDLWGALRVKTSGVSEHFDIGSRIDGFLAHLVCEGIKVNVIDIRPLEVDIPGIRFIQGDATDLSGIMDNSIESMSALCSFEHFGLGRYGDTISPIACFQVFDTVQRVMKKGGKIYLSVPVGRERVAFNAHRVFYPSTVISAFSGMNLREFSVIDIADKRQPLKENADIHLYDEAEYPRTGLFIFEKE